MAVMHEGRIRQTDDPKTLYRRPADRTVAALIGSPPMNLLDGRIESRGGRPVFCHGRLQVPVPEEWTGRLVPYLNEPIALGVRPEHVGAIAGVGKLEALIEAVEPAGPESYLYLNTGRQVVIARVDPRQDFRAGQQVDLAVAPGNLHFFDPRTGDSLA